MVKIVDKKTGATLTTIQEKTPALEEQAGQRSLQRWQENYFRGRMDDDTVLEMKVW